MMKILQGCIAQTVHQLILTSCPLSGRAVQAVEGGHDVEHFLFFNQQLGPAFEHFDEVGRGLSSGLRRAPRGRAAR